jgi:DNA-binding GntR family transcriptional regulator
VIPDAIEFTSPHAPESRTALAVGALRGMIVGGELAPGKRIPEEKLCAHLGLSRTPLREALKILAAEGLVSIEPHRGASVAHLTITDVEDAFQVLVALERLAAPLVCNRITDSEIAMIEELQMRMTAHFDAGRLMEYFRCNQAIHQAIVDASGNKRLAQLYRSESGRVQRYRYAGNEEESRWRRAIKEHEQILDAIRNRSAEVLEALLSSHLMAGWRVVKARIVAQSEAQFQPRVKRRRRAT